MDLNLVIHYDKSYIGILKCIRIRESEKVAEYSAVIEKSKNIILVSSSWTKYLNVINLCSRTFLQDLFARFFLKMAPRDTKELVPFRSITWMISFHQMETL